MKMKIVLLTATLLAVPARAAEPEPTTPVALTEVEVQVLATALSNAGAACDAQLPIYCQVAGARGPVLQKLQRAFETLKKGEPKK